MASTRIVRLLAVVLLTVVGFCAPPAAVAATGAERAQVAADVDDFSYTSWDARYEVGLDAEGRSTMHVTETLVAGFPDFDQNRGIVRGLPTSYEGAGIDTTIVSVTDGQGADVPYETETDDGVLYVLTGDDDYVQGPTTYVIDYTMRDIVLAADTGVDEFSWDLLPLDSTQAIERFSASIVFDPEMSTRLTGSARCYEGRFGSTDECTLQGPELDGEAAEFRVESGERPAGDGVTVAIGFQAGTAARSTTCPIGCPRCSPRP